MAGRPDSFMPLYIGDYLADTAHLSAAEHGAYLLLLMHYWRSGAPLAADDRALMRVTRMTKAEWLASKNVLRGFFKEAIINAVSVWTHTRVERELLKAKVKYESRKAASDAANAARDAKRNAYRDGIPDGELDADQPQPQPHSVPSSEVRTSSDGADAQLRALKKQIWDEGKKLGIKRDAIGKMFQLCGEDANALLTLVLRCAENHKVGRAFDPTSWCFAELHPKPTGPPKLVSVGSADADLAAVVAKNKAMLG